MSEQKEVIQAHDQKLLWIDAVLTNDEGSTDEEMKQYFIEEGLTEPEAIFYIAQRNKKLLDCYADLEEYKPDLSIEGTRDQFLSQIIKGLECEMLSIQPETINPQTATVNPHEPIFRYKIVDKRLRHIINKKKLDWEILTSTIRLYKNFGILAFTRDFIMNHIRTKSKNLYTRRYLRVNQCLKNCFSSMVQTRAITERIPDGNKIKEHFRKPHVDNKGVLRRVKQDTLFFLE